MKKLNIIALIPKQLIKYQNVQNEIHDLFVEEYHKVVPDEVIKNRLESFKWIKMYGKKNIEKAWKDLVEEKFVEKKGNNWEWMVPFWSYTSR